MNCLLVKSISWEIYDIRIISNIVLLLRFSKTVKKINKNNNNTYPPYLAGLT